MKTGFVEVSFTENFQLKSLQFSDWKTVGVWRTARMWMVQERPERFLSF